MSSHHRILGIPAHANLLQIKRAYFKKAKVLHPDVNKSPNAEAEFIKLKMAYDALTDPRFKHPPIFNRKKSYKSKEALKKEWLRKKNAELHRRAKTAANKRQRMAYEETKLFYNSFIFNFINLVFSLFLLIPSGIGFFYAYFDDDEPADIAVLLIGIILFLTGIILVSLFLRYLYNKIFK